MRYNSLVCCQYHSVP